MTALSQWHAVGRTRCLDCVSCLDCVAFCLQQSWLLPLATIVTSMSGRYYLFFTLHTMGKPLTHYAIFWLQNFEKTKAKHENYKPRWQDVDDDSIYSVLNSHVSVFDLWRQPPHLLEFQYRANKTNVERTMLRQLHTYINSWVWTYHQEQYKKLWYTHSQAIKLATRFYIRNYKAINLKMTEFFLEFFDETTIFSDMTRVVFDWFSSGFNS